LEKECAVYKDQYLRSLADFDNYRRRMQREFECVRQAANESLLADLLPILDNFDRALSASAEASKEKLQEGIQLIRRQLTDALGRHGLEEFSCLGQEFDPRRAEAVSFILSDEHEADTVAEEQCKGFSCRGKVIRPAKVVVAKPKKNETVSSETAEKREQED
jgi:molecular chaperone GrpE